jgi:hypothetical protein
MFVDRAENPARRETGISGQATGRRPRRTIVGLLDDAVLLLLVVALLPLAILLFGAPVALLVRLLIEIAQRM